MSGPDATRTTIVVATRNRGTELAETLRKQRLNWPYTPIIVVDNGSDDGTPEVLGSSFPDVEVVRLARNAGAVARDLGVVRARTPYVAFSDDDSWWERDALTIAEGAFDEHPHLGLIAGRTLVGPRDRPDPVNRLMANSPLRSEHRLPGPPILGFTACASIVRKDAFIQAGGFNSLLFFVAEEKLLSYDLAAAGWQLSYVDSVIARHHPSLRRPDGDRRRRDELRNTALIACMRRPFRVAVSEVTGLGMRSLRSEVARSALAATLRRLPRALAHRRRLPAHVERQITCLESRQA